MMKSVLLLLLAAAPAVAQTGVAPLLDCVYAQPDNMVSAFFGYANVNSDAVTVPVGSGNFVTPNPQNWGQPTTFQPGVQNSVWAATFDPSQTSSISWTLAGESAVATNDPSMYCSSPVGQEGPAGPQGVAGSQGPPGDAGPTGAQGLAGAAGDAGVTGPPGLQGLPGATGSQGTGGLAGLQGPPGPQGLTGTQGPPGPQGMQGLTGTSGPAAVLPSIRVVTAESSTSSATASCNTGEVLVGGAGLCSNFWSPGKLASSVPAGSGWTASCLLGAAEAVAICMPAP
ncbi:MAG: hypothetical protein ACRD3S_05460 [Terracidiphilus sp.]